MYLSELTPVVAICVAIYTVIIYSKRRSECKKNNRIWNKSGQESKSVYRIYLTTVAIAFTLLGIMDLSIYYAEEHSLNPLKILIMIVITVVILIIIISIVIYFTETDEKYNKRRIR